MSRRIKIDDLPADSIEKIIEFIADGNDPSLFFALRSVNRFWRDSTLPWQRALGHIMQSLPLFLSNFDEKNLRG